MQLANGDTKNYSDDMRQTELAVIDTSGDDLDQVTAIPDTVLRHNRMIDHSSLPFRIAVRNFYENSRLKMLSKAGERGATNRESRTRCNDRGRACNARDGFR